MDLHHKNSFYYYEWWLPCQSKHNYFISIVTFGNGDLSNNLPNIVKKNKKLQFIEDNSSTVDVTFNIINVRFVLKDFRSDISRSSTPILNTLLGIYFSINGFRTDN